MKKLTQKEKLLIYLQKYKTITGAEAFGELGIYRLSARISDLRKEGYNIETVYETRENKLGEKTTYGKYRFK